MNRKRRQKLEKELKESLLEFLESNKRTPRDRNEFALFTRFRNYRAKVEKILDPELKDLLVRTKRSKTAETLNKSIEVDFIDLKTSGKYTLRRDIIKNLAEKYSLTEKAVDQRLRKIEKKSGKYNENHFSEKDSFTRNMIQRVGEIKSILDPFAGEGKSFYLDPERGSDLIVEPDMIVTNDKLHSGHTFKLDARDVLDIVQKAGLIFDIVDMDPFTQPLYYISLPNLLKLTNKLLFLTMGELNRVKTSDPVRGIWNINFKAGEDPIPQIIEKVQETAKNIGKSAKLLDFKVFNSAGTCRLAFSLEK